MSMDARLDELEKVISQAVSFIASARKDDVSASAVAPSPSSPALEEALRELAEENRLLREERKALRRRVREIIKMIDKVQW